MLRNKFQFNQPFCKTPMHYKPLYSFVLLFALCLSLTAQDNTSYATFDFVAGEKIIYYNNFETDALGELPINWNTTGSAAVVNMSSTKWVKLFQNATFITDNTLSFGKNFTVEFDLYLDFTYQEALFPAFSLGFLNSGNDQPNTNATLQHIEEKSFVAIDVFADNNQNSISRMISYENGTEYFNSGEKPFKALENLYHKTIRVSIQVQEQRLRVWFNAIKMFDVPKALPQQQNMNQLFFRIFESSYSNEQIGIYASNIKVASGSADTRTKLLQEGYFSTSGILFDVNSSTLLPQSYGILNEIALALQSGKANNVHIVGHTDSDGTNESNLQLSKQRSQAVKNYLVQQCKLPEGNITTDGKGENNPLTSNATKEGKAQNRRVEFILN